MFNKETNKVWKRNSWKGYATHDRRNPSVFNTSCLNNDVSPKHSNVYILYLVLNWKWGSLPWRFLTTYFHATLLSIKPGNFSHADRLMVIGVFYGAKLDLP